MSDYKEIDYDRVRFSEPRIGPDGRKYVYAYYEPDEEAPTRPDADTQSVATLSEKPAKHPARGE